MTTHAHFEELAATALDFGLTGTDHTALDRHLATCSTCRAVAAAYATDASALRAIAFAEPPARVRSAVLAASIHPVARTIEPWKLLAAAALMLATVIGAAAAIGAWNSRPTLVVVEPIASQSARPSATAQPTSNAAPSAVEPSTEPAAYTPPSPRCPSPATVPKLPDVTVSVGSSAGKSATLWGSGLATCSTTGTSDGVASEPSAVFTAHPGDRFTLELPAGWTFLHVVAIDRATTPEAVVGSTIDTPDRPSRMEVPVTADPGGSIVGFDVEIISDDDRVVAGLEVGVRVQVSAAPSTSPGGTLTVDPSPGNVDGPGLSVSEAMTNAIVAPELVNGILLKEADGTLWLCEALLGSSPAQCAEPRLLVHGYPIAGDAVLGAAGVHWERTQLFGLVGLDAGQP